LREKPRLRFGARCSIETSVEVAAKTRIPCYCNPAGQLFGNRGVMESDPKYAALRLIWFLKAR
jgi:hypothetical protein